MLDCPLLKGNEAAHPKFERPNGENTKSKTFLKSVKNWCGQLALESSMKQFLRRFESNQNK